ALARGASVVAVDGVALATATSAQLATLNAGLFPATAGETHSLEVLDYGATQPRTVSITSATVSETPVKYAQVLSTASGPVGYVLFSDHIAPAESELVAAVNTFKTAGITDLILDLRYNGGGYLDIASELAFMIAGPAATSGKTFEQLTFNNQYPASVDPVTGGGNSPTPFWSQTPGITGGLAAGQALPALSLARVFVILGGDTCSASEAIINGLSGINVPVILVGGQSCGKPYGFYPQDNCGTTYFSIEFRGVNNQGFGDYPDGFAPVNDSFATGLPVSMPGCPVADDLGHALGDPAEARLAAALGYRATGTCPAASGLAAPPVLRASHVAKPRWLMNRILRRSR
ncbi:MAG: peptidase, partial [Proteobacteria bacterium]|nr:peptidase [Pseudomonadota bacterium]